MASVCHVSRLGALLIWGITNAVVASAQATDVQAFQADSPQRQLIGPDAQALIAAAEEGNGRAVRDLIGAHADVNALAPDHSTALQWVVHRQDLDSARALVRAGAKVDQANQLGMTPLYLAVGNDDAAMVKLLLDAHANPNTTDASGVTCLMRAAEQGNEAIVRDLLAKGASVTQRDPAFQQTALMFAARAGRTAIAKLLLARHAAVDDQTRTGKTPAFRLPSSNAGSKGAGIVRGGWPERGERDPTPGAKTALLYAAREGHLPVVELLLNAGAALEKADADGETPLLMAVENGQLDVALYLIGRGANVQASDWYGQTPLWAAVDVRDLDIPGPHQDNGVDRARALELIRTLLEHGADVNARTKESPPQRRWITRLGSLSWVDFTGQTPFVRAALAGDVEVMHLLLEHHADPNIKTDNGTTALMAAAGVNWTVAQTFDEGPARLLEAVELTQSLGNDVNAVNAMGLTALHGAANRGSDDIIRFLAKHGATLDVADKQGRTALVWAQGVFLATHPPEAKPKTVLLLNQLRDGAS
jgi:ankyrin repeat protein